MRVRALALVLVFLVALPALAANIRDLKATWSGKAMELSWVLEGAFPDEVREQIQSGDELRFTCTVQLRRKRSFLDKLVASREVTLTVRFSNLTKMYSLTRSIDGTVTDQDVTERAGDMLTWMSRFKDPALFDSGDLDESGTYYLKVKAKLLERPHLLLIPGSLETGWAEVPPFAIRIDRGEVEP